MPHVRVEVRGQAKGVLVLSFYRVGPGDQPQVVGLSSKGLYPLSHLTGALFLNCIFTILCVCVCRYLGRQAGRHMHVTMCVESQRTTYRGKFSLSCGS